VPTRLPGSPEMILNRPRPAAARAASPTLTTGKPPIGHAPCSWHAFRTPGCGAVSTTWQSEQPRMEDLGYTTTYARQAVSCAPRGGPTQRADLAGARGWRGLRRAGKPGRHPPGSSWERGWARGAACWTWLGQGRRRAPDDRERPGDSGRPRQRVSWLLVQGNGHLGKEMPKSDIRLAGAVGLPPCHPPRTSQILRITVRQVWSGWCGSPGWVMWWRWA
jgi:hypothetical protein